MTDEPEITVVDEESDDAGPIFDRDTCYGAIRKLRAEVDASSDRSRAALMCHAIGWIFERQLGDVQQASVHYQEALSKDPALVPAIRALRRRAFEQGNWMRYVALIDSELEHTSSLRFKAQLLVEKAEILGSQLDEADRARQSLEEALDMVPDHAQALWCLEGLHRSRRDSERLDEVLQRLVELLPGSELEATLAYESARLEEIALDDPVAAVDRYEALISRGTREPRARAALRRLQLRDRDFSSIVRDLRQEAKELDGPERSRALYTVARILNDHLGEMLEAIEALEQAFDADPDSGLVLAELVRLYPLVGRLDRLAECYREQIRLSADARERAALYHRLGQLYEEQLEDDEHAEEALLAALDEDPTNTPALTSLAVFYQKRKRLDDLVELNLREAEHTESPVRRALALHRGGEILESRGEAERAAELYGRALEALPTFLPSFNALEQLYERAERWEDLVDLLGGRAAREDNPFLSASLLERSARIREERLSDPQGAYETFGRVLEVDPTSKSALGALVRLSRDLALWTEHVEHLGRSAELSDDDQHVVSLLLRMGEIQEGELGEEEEAIATYQRLLSVDPFFHPAIRNLGRLLHRKGMFQELVTLHRQELDTTTESDERSLIHYRIGRLYEERIDDLDEAASAYQAAIMEDARNFAASWCLYRIYLKREDWLSIIDILETEANALEDGHQRAMALVRVGELWEEPLGRPDMAADAYMQALRAQPGAREAREALISMSEQEGNWDHLSDLLYQEFQTSVDEGEQYRLAMQLGELTLERMNNPRKAMDWYMKALAIRPDSIACLRATEHALRAAGEWPSFVEVRRKLVALVEDEPTRIALFHGLELVSRLHDLRKKREGDRQVLDLEEIDFSQGGVLGDLLLESEVRRHGDPGSQIRYFESRLEGEDVPESYALGDGLDRAMALVEAGLLEDAYEELGKMASSGSVDVLALLLMERIAQASGDRAGLVEVATKLGESLQKPAFRAESLVHRGVARLEEPEEREAGLADLEQALDLDPDNPEAFTALVQVLGRDAEWERLTQIITRLAERVKDEQRAVDVFGTLGSLQWKRLGDPAQAIKSFNRVLKHDASHGPTLMSLLDLYMEQEQENEAMAVARHLIAASDDPEVYVEASLKLADLVDREDRDPEEVVETLRRILERDPSNRPVLERLVALYRKSGELDAALEAIEQIVEIEQEPVARASLLVDQAEIADMQLGNEDSCLDLLDRALGLDPSSHRALALLVKVLGKQERWPELTEKLRVHLEYVEDDDVSARAYILGQLSTIYEDHLDDGPRAAESLGQAFDLDPACGDTGRRLFDQLVGGGETDEALEVATRMLEHDPLCFEILPPLVGLLEERGRLTRAALLAQIPFYFGMEDETCARLAAQMRKATRDAPLAPLDEDDLASLRGDIVDHPARDIVEYLGRPGGKFLVKGLDEYGLERGDRLDGSDEQGAVLLAACERAARLLGVDEYDVFLIPSQDTDVVVEMYKSPALLFSSIVTEISEIEQRLVAAQAMARIRTGSTVALKLAASELEELLVAVARVFDPGFGEDVTGMRRVEELGEELRSDLGRKQRKELEPLVEAYRGGGWLDCEEWHFEMGVTGMKLAMLACGDLGCVLDAIKKRDPALLGVPLKNLRARREAFLESELAVAVLRFLLDESCPELWERYCGKPEPTPED